MRNKRNKRYRTIKGLRVFVKPANESLNIGDRIVVLARQYHKVIPVVMFSPKEAQTLLEIVDKVERDTNANIVYK